MADVRELLDRTGWILDQLAPESMVEFLTELSSVSFAQTGTLEGVEGLLDDWVTSLLLQADPEWQRQMAETG